MAKRCGLKSDIISNFPENIIEKILVHLPIKEAVKTSVLSSKQRYKWATIPELVFREMNFQNKTDKLITFIDRALLAHRGPIQRFELSMTSLRDRSAIDSWVPFLSRNNVKELKLGFLDVMHERYKVPFSLFSCEALSSLDLSNCILQPPPTFKGFRNLTILHLKNITLPTEEIFESMISNCLVLEDLSLTKFKKLTCLKINALSLQRFCLDGYFEDICFVDAPSLIDVYINLKEKSEKLLCHQVTPRVIDVLGCLTNVKKLGMHGHFLQLLVMFNLPGGFQLPFSYHHLRSLSLFLNFEDLSKISVTICLIKGAPYLQELEIAAESKELFTVRGMVEDFLEEQDKLNCFMNHLRRVIITDMLGARTEMEYVKFILTNSPMLEVLSLTPKGGIYELIS